MAYPEPIWPEKTKPDILRNTHFEITELYPLMYLFSLCNVIQRSFSLTAPGAHRHHPCSLKACILFLRPCCHWLTQYSFVMCSEWKQLTTNCIVEYFTWSYSRKKTLVFNLWGEQWLIIQYISYNIEDLLYIST